MGSTAEERKTIAFRYRSALKRMTLANHKTPKGEGAGYLTATLYLLPHTLGGGPTLCPHSTPACREMCLSGAGMSGLPLQMAAKLKRTQAYHYDRERFLNEVQKDIRRLKRIAARHGLTPAVRLNGTSDIRWEFDHLLQSEPELQFYDYTKIPLHHRRPPANYHLTFSVDRNNIETAAAYLLAGHSVAAVVPEWVKASIVTPQAAPWRQVVDGDAHDLRFLDKPGSLVLLKPKGNVVTDLVIPDVDGRLIAAAQAMKAA